MGSTIVRIPSRGRPAVLLGVFTCVALLLVACGGSSSEVPTTPVIATPSPSASPEPTLVLGTCAALLPLGERPAPAILRGVRAPAVREGVRELFDRIPREIDGKRLLPFVGPPEIFAARYGDDATLVLSAKQLAQNETGQSAIERDVAASSARCKAGRDGDLVWAVLSGPDHVVIRWATIDGGWSFGAVAPDMARAEMLLAAYREATGSGDATTSTRADCVTTGVSITMIPDIASLAWASDQIVVGAVVRQHPSTPDPQRPQQPLHTDFDIRVESFVRGEALETVTVRQPGGEIPGGCADSLGQLELALGDRFLLCSSSIATSARGLPRPGSSSASGRATGG